MHGVQSALSRIRRAARAASSAARSWRRRSPRARRARTMASSRPLRASAAARWNSSLSAERKPCRQLAEAARALPCSVRAPVEAPPCIRHRPFGIAGARHGVPDRVLAPQRGALCGLPEGLPFFSRPRFAWGASGDSGGGRSRPPSPPMTAGLPPQSGGRGSRGVSAGGSVGAAGTSPSAARRLSTSRRRARSRAAAPKCATMRLPQRAERTKSRSSARLASCGPGVASERSEAAMARA